MTDIKITVIHGEFLISNFIIRYEENLVWWVLAMYMNEANKALYTLMRPLAGGRRGGCHNYDKRKAIHHIKLIVMFSTKRDVNSVVFCIAIVAWHEQSSCSFSHRLFAYVSSASLGKTLTASNDSCVRLHADYICAVRINISRQTHGRPDTTPDEIGNNYTQNFSASTRLSLKGISSKHVQPR